MARPCKLTQAQVEELRSCYLAGEPMRSLAKRFKISPTTVCRVVSQQVNLQKQIATNLAVAELSLESLPVSEQITVRSLTDQIKGISNNIGNAALSGSHTAAYLNAIASKQVLQVNEHGTIDENAAPLRNIMMISQVANEAAKIPLNLLNANKKVIEDMNERPADNIPTDLGFLYGR